MLNAIGLLIIIGGCALDFWEMRKLRKRVEFLEGRLDNHAKITGDLIIRLNALDKPRPRTGW